MGRQLNCIVRGSGPQNFIKKTLSGISMGKSFAIGSITNVLKVMKGSLQRDPGISVFYEEKFFLCLQKIPISLIASPSSCKKFMVCISR